MKDQLLDKEYRRFLKNWNESGLEYALDRVNLSKIKSKATMVHIETVVDIVAVLKRDLFQN